MQTLIFNFLSPLIKLVTHLGFSNCISGIALALSIFTLWQTRKQLSVEWSDNIMEASIGSVFAEKEAQIIGTYDYAYVAYISILNPSPKDISFFDLRAFNPKNNSNLSLVTRQTLGLNKDGTRIFQIYDDKTSTYAELDIPNRKYGLLKANSYTRFDLVVVLPQESEIDLDRINISLKVSKRSLFKRDHFSKKSLRNKYLFFGKSFKIEGWQSRRQSQQQALSAEMKYETDKKTQQAKQM